MCYSFIDGVLDHPTYVKYNNDKNYSNFIVRHKLSLLLCFTTIDEFCKNLVCKRLDRENLASKMAK